MNKLFSILLLLIMVDLSVYIIPVLSIFQVVFW